MLLTSIIKPGMRGVFYGRHSTDRQQMDAQRNLAVELINKYGCEFVGEYLDTAVSARKKNLNDRKGVSQLLADAHLDKYDFVVVSHHDRLARNPKEHQMIRYILRERKIPVIIASPESLYDSGDLLTDLIKDGNSKFEIDNTRVRTKDTLHALFKKGKWRGGKPPFGYRYNKETKRIESVEHQLIVVKEIFERYMRYQGFDNIAKELPRGSYDGCDWTDQAIRAIVTNPFYAGYLTRGRRKSGANNSFNDRSKWELNHCEMIPAVITMDEWVRCWDLYEKRIGGSAPPKRFKTTFLLSDLLTCEECGNKLKGKDKTTKGKKGRYGSKYYWCPVCDYRVETSRAHRIVDFLLKDLRSRHEDLVVKNVLESVTQDILRLEHEVEVLSLTLSEFMQRLSELDSEIKHQFDLIQRLDVDAPETERNSVETLIRILTMSKESWVARIESVGKQLEDKRMQIKRSRGLNLHAEFVKSKLEKLMLAGDDLRLRRGLLLEFVQNIEINSRGNVHIFARHEILKIDL